MQKSLKIVVVVEGGIVQCAFVDDPLVAPAAELVVIDWDADETEGEEYLEDRVVAHPEDGTMAYVGVGNEVHYLESGSPLDKMIQKMKDYYKEAQANGD